MKQRLLRFMLLVMVVLMGTSGWCQSTLNVPEMWYYYDDTSTYRVNFNLEQVIDDTDVTTSVLYSLNEGEYQTYDSEAGEVAVAVGTKLSYYATAEGYNDSPVTTVTATEYLWTSLREAWWEYFGGKGETAVVLHDDGPVNDYRYLMYGGDLVSEHLGTPDENLGDGFNLTSYGIYSDVDRTYAMTGLEEGQVISISLLDTSQMEVGENTEVDSRASAIKRAAKNPRRVIAGGTVPKVTAGQGLELDEWNSDDNAAYIYKQYYLRVTDSGNVTFTVAGGYTIEGLSLLAESAPDPPSINQTAINGAYRTLRIYNSGTTLYYTTAVADEMPEKGSANWSSTTNSYVDVTVTGQGNIYAYAANKAGSSDVSSQYVNGVALTLNAPVVSSKSYDSTTELWTVTLSADQTYIEGRPTAAIYYKIGDSAATLYSEAFTMADGATLTMWTEATGYVNSAEVTATAASLPGLQQAWYESYTYSYNSGTIDLGDEVETGLYQLKVNGSVIGSGHLLTPDENIGDGFQMTYYNGIYSSSDRTFAVSGLTAGQYLTFSYSYGTIGEVSGATYDSWNSTSTKAYLRVTADGTVTFTLHRSSTYDLRLQNLSLYKERTDGTVVMADANGNQLTYYYEDATSPATLTGISSYADDEEKAGHIIIADKVTDAKGNEHTVTTIQSLLTNRSDLKSVVFGANITTLGTQDGSYYSPFYSCSSLESVTLNANLETMTTYTFYGCSALKSINLGDATKLTAIPDYAFYGTMIESITIPAGVTTIGNYAFSGCTSLRSVTVPASVTTLGTNAFSGCTSLSSVTFAESAPITVIPQGCFYYCSAIETLTLPNAVKTVGSNAFYGMTGLREITFGDQLETNAFYNSSYLFYNCSNVEKMTIPGINFPFQCSMYSLPTSMMLFVHPDMVQTYKDNSYTSMYHIMAIGTETDYAITTTAGGQLATKIPAETAANALSLKISGPINGTDINYLHELMPYLEDLDLKDAQIVAGGEDYYRYSFSNNVATKNTSDHWQTQDNIVGQYMFYNMPNLKRLLLPNGVTEIEQYGVASTYTGTSYTKLQYVELPASLTTIDNNAFRNDNSLTQADIPSGVTSIGQNAFYYTAITEATIPAGVTSIGNYTFYYCQSLKTVSLPDGLTSIGEQAFYNCTALETCNIPQSLVTIGNSAFSNCNKLASSLAFPASLKTIGSYAFQSCYLMPGVTFSEGLETIGSYAFNYCYALTEVQLPASLTSLGSYAFSGAKALTAFTFPAAIRQVPEGVLSGCEAIENVTLAEGTTQIGNYAFQNCPKLATVNNLDQTTLTSIGYYAFCNTGLTTVNVPGSVTSISGNAFSNCTSLKTATLPNSVTTMGTYVFSDCTALESANIPTGVTTVPGYTFMGCSKLTSVTLHNGITQIGSQAFYGCTQLPAVSLGNAVTTIGSSAFYNCQSLTLTALPTALTTIGSYAFKDTKNLGDALTLPETLTSLGNEAFYGSGIKAVTISKPITDFNSYVFQNCESLESVTLPEGMTTIPYSTFRGTTKLQSIALPTSLQTIEDYAFYGSGLTEVSLPAKLETIGSYAFADTQLEEITVPKNVTSVGSRFAAYCSSLKTAKLGRKQDYAINSYFDYFYGCDNLELLRVYAGTPPAISTSYYYNYTSYRTNCVLEVPEGQVEVYQATDIWKEFKEIRAFESEEWLNDADFAAMQKLYQQADGANWTKTWNLESSRHANGKWQGVSTEVDSEDDELFYITAIDLTAFGLNGTLPKELFALERMTSLNLSHNTLEAKVDTLVNAENTVLTTLNLEGNHLRGDLAKLVKQLPSLTSLNVSYNWLTAYSEATPNTTLTNYNMSRGYQFVDWQTKEVSVPDDLMNEVVTDYTPNTPIEINSNTLQTYRHEYGDWGLDISYMYRLYKSGNYLYTTSEGALQKDDGLWNSDKYYNVFKAPKGQLSAYTSTNPYWSYITHIVRVDWEDGDVNGDRTVDVSDVQNVVYYALNDSRPGSYNTFYNYTAADLNGDDKINVSDIVGTVACVLNFEEPAASRARTYNSIGSERNQMYIEGSTVCLENVDEVAAMQLTVSGASKGQLTLATPLKGRFYVTMRDVDGGVKVVIYSPMGNTLAPGQNVLLTGLPAGAAIADARLTDSEAQYLGVSFSAGSATGIDSLGIDTMALDHIYDLNGRRLGRWDTLPAGIYIVNVNGKQYKVRK